MAWEAVSALAELIGAVGVVASLLYLSVQVRTSNRASAVQSKLESTRLLSEFMDILLEHPEQNQLLIRGRQDLGSFSPDEYLQFSNLSLKAFWFFSAGYFQFRKRTLSDGDWFEIRAVIHYWLRAPGCREWWDKLGRSMFGADFVAFIDSEIAALAP